MKPLGSAHAFSTATPHEFFSRWCDHSTWSKWSPDCEWVRLDGPLTVGARGVLKPKGGPKVKFVISRLIADREYTDTSLLPGARLLFRHEVKPHGTGSELLVDVTMTGPLTFLWSRLMGGGFKTSASEDLSRLITLVEKS